MTGPAPGGGDSGFDSEATDPTDVEVARREDRLAPALARGVAGGIGLAAGGLTAIGVIGSGVPTTLARVAMTSLGAAGAFVFLGYALSGGERGREAARQAVIGATLVGGLTFAAGFLGPLILTPEANQGPLLGIFITGPIGVAVGAVGGFLKGWLGGGSR